jgi:anaerobic magnesium-protoporphyrin IX monomethyl ester cyclase
LAKVLFLQSIRHDYLGVMMVSASLKQSGHECSVAIGNKFSDFADLIREETPGIIAFSLMSGLHLWANDMADAIKGMPDLDKKPFIIYGGPHPTFFPDIVKHPSVDTVCVGEGEGAMVDLANCLDRGEDPKRIANLQFFDGEKMIANPLRPLVDLDSLPFPDRSIYYKYWQFRSTPTKPFMTGRGCPYNCTFCYNKTIRDMYKGKGAFVRQRSVENMIAEIKSVKKQWGMRSVYFFDDTFGLDKNWTMEFMAAYRRELALPFVCRIRANSIDEEMIEAFKNARCYAVFFSVETANEDMRERVLKKRVSNEDIYRTAALLKKHRIRFLTYNMVGLPGETIEDIYNTIKLNVEIETAYPWCSIFNPYPGTELAEYCVEKGYLDEELGPDDLATTYHKTSLIKSDISEEVANLHKFFQLAVLMPWLIPVIRKAAKRKPNFLWTLIFAGVYFINYIRSERAGLLRTIILAYHNTALILGRRT